MPDVPAFIPLKESNMLLQEHEEQPKTLLSREALLLGGGIKDGFVDRVKQASENPWLTALEFSGAALLGAGLRTMSMAGGRWAAVSKAGAGALQFLAVADGIRRVVPTAYAMGDTAVNPDHYRENRAVVARNIGSACFDYPLMAAGGALGSSAAGFAPRAISSLSDSFRTVKAGNVEVSNPLDHAELTQNTLSYCETVMERKVTFPNVKFGDPLSNACVIGGRLIIVDGPPMKSFVFEIEAPVRNLVYPALWTSWEKEKLSLPKH